MIGIYFLSLNGEVIYIGQSLNLLSRIGSHAASFYFDDVSYMPCEEKDLNELERRYVRAFMPKLNKIIPSPIYRRKDFIYPQIPQKTEEPEQYDLQAI